MKQLGQAGGANARLAFIAHPFLEANDIANTMVGSRIIVSMAYVMKHGEFYAIPADTVRLIAQALLGTVPSKL